MAGSLTASPVARVDDELTFDVAIGRLSLGVFDVSVPPGSANAVVLDAYVDLVTQRRGYRPAEPVEVRSDDIDVLAGLLDCDATDIDRFIAQILGTPAEETAGLVDRLRSRKLALGLATAAAGLVVLGSLTMGPGRSPTPPSPTPVVTTAPAPTAPSTTEPTPSPSTTVEAPRPPVTENADGVGLVDPVEQDVAGVGLAPPATAAPG